MSRWRADFAADTPSARQRTLVVFYAAGLKIYGLIPYLLNRRVGGEFRSNETAGMIFPTFEPNYTMVRYGQPVEAAGALLDWLYADAGFSWGIAEDWNNPHLFGNNALNAPPRIYHIADASRRGGFSEVLRRAAPQAADLVALIGGAQ